MEQIRGLNVTTHPARQFDLEQTRPFRRACRCASAM